MTAASPQREKLSLQQLNAVSQSRQTRLKTERQVLSEREHLLEQAMYAQRLDEALLAQQRAQWTDAWNSWARGGGAMRHAVALRRDKELLVDMAALLERRRGELQLKLERLANDIMAWAKRWHAAQEFEGSLTERARLLRLSLERASERQRDEESLMVLASTTRSPVGLNGVAAARC